MDSDDRQSGRILTRREALALLGGTALLAGGVPPRPGIAQSMPDCVVTPEQMDGPYFVDARLNRSDIRSDPADKTIKQGVPLNLILRISTVGGAGCTPLAGAMVDVWHCDAAGLYSGVQDRSFDTSGQQFLRGFQWDGKELRPAFEVDFTKEKLGRAHHMKLGSRALHASDKKK